MDKSRAVVVGGGHNGLVCAFYLAEAGLDVTVIEQREIVGGAATTEEFVPGFRTNTASNITHAIEPRIIANMELERFGLKWVYAEPTAFFAYPDGRALIGYHDAKLRHEQVAQFSRKDADVYDHVLRKFNVLGEALDIDFFGTPPSLSELARKAEKSPEVLEAFMEMMFRSVQDFVDEHFESEQVKTVWATLGTLVNTTAPSHPGTLLPVVYRALYTMSSKVKEANGFQEHFAASRRVPVGGMGSVTDAMARSLEARGVTIITGGKVSEIVTSGNRVTGVRFDDREVPADIVVSAINPKTTLTKLIDPSLLGPELRERVERLDMRGNMFKMMIALDGLPRFAAATDDDLNLVLAGCSFRAMGSIAEVERGYHEARAGQWSSAPMIWGFLPSVYDPTLAPEGKHTLSLSVLHAPPDLAEGMSWDTEKKKFAKRIWERLEEIAPGIGKLKLGEVTYSPLDLEARLGMLGGNAAHGDLTPSRMFFARPAIGISDYGTPVDGLYLSGVGTWPAMLVSGVPGHNTAKKVLSDLRADEGTDAHRASEGRLTA